MSDRVCRATEYWLDCLKWRRWARIACITVLASFFCLHAATAEEGFRFLAPSGKPPHPVVLLVPGCSGFSANNGGSHYEERAAELQAAGYMPVFVDYIVRRMQTNCAHVTLAEVTADILEAATWARNQPDVDTDRISVIGWSYGGGGVLAALQVMPPDPPIAKAVMYYPVCRGAVPWSTVIPALLLLGGKDDIAYPRLCKAVVDGVPADRLHVVFYPDARHGFDVQSFQGRADQPGAPVYNPDAAKASWAAVLDFLR